VVFVWAPYCCTSQWCYGLQCSGEKVPAQYAYAVYTLRRTLVMLSPDLATKHASTNISPRDLQLESTGTTPIMNAPTVAGYTTHLLNAQSSSRKRSIMRRVSRQILSQYLLSLRKARPLLAATQSVRSSPYHGGQGNLGPN